MFKHALVLAAFMAAPLSLSAQGYDGPGISLNSNEGKVFVTGEGRVTVVPDRVRVILSSDARSSDRETASTQVRDLAASVRSAVIEAGIPEEKLRTLRTSLGPIYDYGDGNGVPKIAGYAGSTGMEIVVDDASVAGAAIDAAIKAGATGVSGPFFEISDPKAAESEARALAMKDAIARANTLAEAGEFSLGAVVTVTDNTSGHGGVRPMMMAMRAESADMSAAEPTQLDSGEEEVTSSVSVIFRIAPDDLGR